MLGDWIPWIVITIAALTTPLEIYIVLRMRRPPTPSPLQALERRLAAGEISPEEFQYERFLLEKGG